ncbi:unnamed protein product [Merluccius merluccius]
MQCGEGYDTRRSRLAPGGHMLLRAAGLPNAGLPNRTGGLSSITISTRNVAAESRCGADECVRASLPVQPLTSTTTRPPSGGGHLTSAGRSERASCPQPDLCGRSPTMGWWEEVKRRRSTVNKDHQRPSPRWSERANPSNKPDPRGVAAAARDQDVTRDSFRPPPSPPLHRSWVHLQLPLQSSFSVVFLEKPLFVPLEGLESSEAETETGGGGRQGVQPTAAGRSPVPPGGPPFKQQCPRLAEVPAPSVDYRANDAETLLEILSFRGMSRRPAEERRGNGDEDERRCPSQSSLKEALELRRPDFISRSQGRMRSLEQRVRMRRRRRRRSRLGDRSPDQDQNLGGGDAGQRRRNCTTPHPLSDNLFQPRERSISGREMQLRSRRMYNRLPEVARRREEDRRKELSQSNRLRAEIFKKSWSANMRNWRFVHLVFLAALRVLSASPLRGASPALTGR